MAPRQAPDTYTLTRLSNSRHAPFQTSPPQHEHFLHCCAWSGHQETDAYATEAAARAVRAQCARNSHGTQISFLDFRRSLPNRCTQSQSPKGRQDSPRGAEICRGEMGGMQDDTRATSCIWNLRFRVPGNAARWWPTPYFHTHCHTLSMAHLLHCHLLTQLQIKILRPRHYTPTKTHLSKNLISGVLASAGNSQQPRKLVENICELRMGVEGRGRSLRGRITSHVGNLRLCAGSRTSPACPIPDISRKRLTHPCEMHAPSSTHQVYI